MPFDIVLSQYITNRPLAVLYFQLNPLFISEELF